MISIFIALSIVLSIFIISYFCYKSNETSNAHEIIKLQASNESMKKINRNLEEELNRTNQLFKQILEKSKNYSIDANVKM